MIRVLIIDKSEVTQDIVREILTLTLHEQIDFQFASNGIQAKKIFTHFSPNLIITDCSSPGMADEDVIEIIRNLAKIPVIAIFSDEYASQNIDYSHELARKVGASYTLSKDKLIKSLPSIAMSALQNISVNFN